MLKTVINRFFMQAPGLTRPLHTRFFFKWGRWGNRQIQKTAITNHLWIIV